MSLNLPFAILILCSFFNLHFTKATKVETRENHAKVDRDRKYVKWNLVKNQQFINDLFSDEIGRVKHLYQKRDAILSNDNVTHDCIDDIVSDLQKFFVDMAKSTCGYMSNKQIIKDQLILIKILGLLILVKKREMSSTKLVINIDLINLMERRKS
jgi:hypothetical protein